MKKILLLTATAVMLLTSCRNEEKSGFAIVVDPVSYNEAKAEIDGYQKTVETRGLYPILVIDRWGIPDSIRAELIRLYNAEDYPIEGCVFIGDIPVAMVRDAQHMASAFKMDQDAFPRIETHIPSDRFYDSFDLQFDYLDKDSARYFYYSLRADGAQSLSPTIYSARIAPRDNERGNRYEKLRRYLKRVNESDASHNSLDNVLMFGGDGNLSGSFAARTDSKMEFYDQFPWMKDQRLSVTYVDYTRDKYIKTRLTDELQNPLTDYALLSHHGDATIQYLSGTRNPLDLLVTEEFGHFHPQTPLVSLDACYNGSFHLDDNIQEAYLFGEGNGTLMVLANSVNAIQDKWVNRYSGLLGLGMRSGYMASLGTFMEFHLFGDPTYMFVKSADCGFDINDAILHKGDKFWLKQLDNPYPAVQGLAAHMLAMSRTDWSGVLLERFKTSESGIVRLSCLMELTKYRNDNFKQCVLLALHDEHEMTQRFAVLFAGKCGDPMFYEPIASLRAENNLSERVDFDLTNSLRSYDSTAFYSAFHNALQKCTYYSNPDSVKAYWDEQLQYTAGHEAFPIREVLSDPNVKPGRKKLAFNSSRNNVPHYEVDNCLEYLSQPILADSSVQVVAWEAMGWFNMSYRAADIAALALEVSRDDRFPAKVRNEALKTYNRTK